MGAQAPSLIGLPQGLVGEKVVQLSDLHVGPQVELSYLANVLRKVASLRPRWVLLSGDFITYDGPWVVESLDRLLGMVSPLGARVFACLGNHDYGENWSQRHVGDAVGAILARHSIEVLRNQSVVSDGLQLIGLDDYWGLTLIPERPCLSEPHPFLVFAFVIIPMRWMNRSL